MSRFKRRRKNTLETYTEAEIAQLEGYIKERFGDFPTVFHELASPDIHVDIALIPPSAERGCQTLVTMGMGAHRMRVPEELADYCLERAEIVAYLPPDWRLDSADERWYWPIRWMKTLARLPILEDSWLGQGHTATNEEPFAENTALNGIMLISPTGEEREVLELEDGDVITFYQMLPLYEEEMAFKIAHSSAALLERFSAGELHAPICTDRRNVCL